MSDIVQAGFSIEGLKVNGHSRNPLVNRGLNKTNSGLRYTLYIASFDVKSHVVISCSKTLFEEDAIISNNSTIVCKKAQIRTLAGKYSSSLAPGSGTHNANHWSFPRQTNVKIELVHEEILNALNNRIISIGGPVKIFQIGSISSSALGSTDT